MVKEGPFLNSDKDYPNKCSKLVHLKKSKKIFEDVFHLDELVQPVDRAKQAFSAEIDKHKPGSVHFVKARKLVHADEEMIDNETLVDNSQVHPILEMPLTPDQRDKSDNQVAEVGLASRNAPSVHHSPQPTPAKVGMVSQMTHRTVRNNSLEKNIQSSVLCIPQETVTRTAPEIDSSDQSYFESVLVSSAPLSVVIESPAAAETTMSIQNIEDEEATIDQEKENEEDMVVQQKIEAAMAKLKLILRLASLLHLPFFLGSLSVGR